MYFIADDKHFVIEADASNFLKLGLGPNSSARVVRVAQDHCLAAFDSLLQQREVYLEVLSVFAFLKDQRAVNFLASCIGDLVGEREIDRRENQNLVSRLGKAPQGMGNSHDDSRNEANLIIRDFPVIAVLEPGFNCIIPFLRTASVTQHSPVNSLYQSIGEKFWSGKVHICNPHREQVLLAPYFLSHVPFDTACTHTVQLFVKIIFCHNVYCCICSSLIW